MASSKKNADYWRERFEQLEDAQNNKGTEYFHDLERIYQKAANETEKEIAKWYMRYAKNEGITLTEAKKQLTFNELKEFRMSLEEYIEKGESLDPKWAKELERASTKFHVTRLEALKLQMQQQVEYLMGQEADGVDKLMRSIYTDSYYRTAFEIQKGIGVGWDLMSIDSNLVDKTMVKPWTADGTNFSERIWGKYRPELIKKLHDGLTQNLILGKSPDKLIEDIKKQFNVKKHQSENLVRTEKAYFMTVAQNDSFNNIGVKQYEIVATLDTKTSDICRSMDGKVFDMKDFAPGSTAPPFHNRCRTATAPYFDDEFDDMGERAARDEEGQYYTVPSNMKYDDWYDSFILGGSKDGMQPVPNDSFLEIKNPLDLSSLSNEEVIDWVDNYYNVSNGSLSLTDEELKALDDYGEGSYSVINGVERFEEGSDGWNRLLRNYGNKIDYLNDAKEKSKHLSNALSKFELDKDIIVHRAVRDISYMTDDVSIEGLKKLKGEVITEKGYISTSLTYQSKFEGRNPDAVHMEFVLPKGTNGAYIDKYVAKNENEFLLNKDTSYKVLDVGERTVKSRKLDSKTKQWVEFDKKERYMKVQVLPESKKLKFGNKLKNAVSNATIKLEKIPEVVKLDVSNFPQSFIDKSEIANTQKMIDFVNELDNPNQDVLKLYNSMSKMENIESNGIPFKITHGKSNALTPSYYASTNELVDIKLNIPKLKGDDLRGQINTMLHEEMHLIDFYNRKEIMKYSEYFSTQQKGLVDAVLNNTDEIGDDIQKLFDDFNEKYKENTALITNEYIEKKNILKKSYLDEFGGDMIELYRTSPSKYREMGKAIKKLETELNYALNYSNRNLLGGGINGLQDIYDALSSGKLRDAGTVKYGHGSKYFRDIDARVHEIVANYGALSITRPDLIEMLKKDKPKLAEELDKYVKEMLKKVGD